MSVQLTGKGAACIAKAEGGVHKVGDKVLMWLDVGGQDVQEPVTILRLYKHKSSLGPRSIREYADVQFEDGEIFKDEMTMFFE